MAIFIPEKCCVGFQKREDTFTKKLAFVVYYDKSGKLRQEASWRGWCHLEDEEVFSHWDGKHPNAKRVDRVRKGIPPEDFNNVPTSGFVLNKGVRRFSWSRFGSDRSMIRIYDPRGYEFEITPENLVGILMHADCSKREISCELVYAWNGGKLMLLPVNSDEYNQGIDHTSRQGKKVSAKELKEGATYTTKDGKIYVYIGRHMHYFDPGYFQKKHSDRYGKKTHMFAEQTKDGILFIPVTSVPSKIAQCEDENCHDNFANWIDEYLKTPEASEIVDFRAKRASKKHLDKARSLGCSLETREAIRLFKKSGDCFLLGYIKNASRYTGWQYDRDLGFREAKPRLEFHGSQTIHPKGYVSWSNQGKCEFTEADTYFESLTAIYANGKEKEL